MAYRITPRAAAVRQRMVTYANYLYVHRSHLGYEEYRPMRSFQTAWCHLPEHDTDCSESLSMIAHASGAPTAYVTPSGGGYAGYTGTMLAHLPHIGIHHARRGDFAVVGITSSTPGGQHVVMLLQRGLYHPDPIVWSHGAPGVDEMPLSQMLTGWPGEAYAILRSVPADL